MQPVASIWYGVDPLTEEYPYVSGYIYCLGNPVILVDPDGNSVGSKVAKLLVKVAKKVAKHGVGALKEVSTYTSAFQNLIDDYETVTSEKNTTFEKICALGDAASELLPVSASDAKTVYKYLTKGKGLKNAKQVKEGVEFEKKELAKATKQGKNVSSQKRLVPQNGKGNVKGNRTNADQLIKNDDGTFTIVETKRSSSTRLSKGQRAAKNHVENGNGIFEVRSYDYQHKLKPGDKIKVSEYKRHNKYE